MNPENFQKWDVIKFRRSNESRSKIGIVRNLSTESNMLGEKIVSVDFEIGSRREIVFFGSEFGSIKQWEYLHNANPENWD